MTGDSTILLVGGAHDGQRVSVLYGDSVIMTHGGTGERELYDIVQLAGTSRRFAVGVAHPHVLDGDWLIERLLEGYQA